MSEIGKRIVMLRAERGWDQTALAERSGVSISTISRFETGKKEPTLEQLMSLGRAFGVTINMINPTVNPANFDKFVVDSMAAQQPKFAIPDARPGRIPLFIQNTAGLLGEFGLPDAMRSETDCPPWLASVPGAFAIQIPDMHMSPRFRAGETIFIHPKAPVRKFDDVIVLWDQIEGETPLVYAGQYLEVSEAEFSADFDDSPKRVEPAYKLKQFGQTLELKIPTVEAKIMKIVGALFP